MICLDINHRLVQREFMHFITGAERYHLHATVGLARTEDEDTCLKVSLF